MAIFVSRVNSLEPTPGCSWNQEESIFLANTFPPALGLAVLSRCYTLLHLKPYNGAMEKAQWLSSFTDEGLAKAARITHETTHRWEELRSEPTKVCLRVLTPAMKGGKEEDPRAWEAMLPGQAAQDRDVYS